jgi:hypothetical protein
MHPRSIFSRAAGISAVAVIWWGLALHGQSAEPPVRLAERLTPSPAQRPDLRAHAPGEHPLAPAIRMAQDGLREMETIRDYSATLVKRERVGETLGEPQYMFIKIRHEPFSVYMQFLGPASLKGQEVIYVANRNEGKMRAHGTGLQRMLGTISLDPEGMIAMRGNRYPITEIGMVNLLRRLVEVGQQELALGNCQVRVYPGAKINGRVCTCVEVLHPEQGKQFRYHVARIFIDDELNVPTRFESYDWPDAQGGKPKLLEEYTYLNLKLNNGFTDADFDTNNSQYNFR